MASLHMDGVAGVADMGAVAVSGNAVKEAEAEAEAEEKKEKESNTTAPTA